METVWDHHPTGDELRQLGVHKRDDFDTWAGPDTHTVLIIGLIGLRGGSVADQMVYVNRIQDPSTRLDWTLLLNEIGE